MIAPTLQTERLALRPMKIGDFDAYLAFRLSERSQFMGGPYDLVTAWGAFCHDVALWELYGYGALMIDVADGTTVGQVGINAGPLYPEAELGWLLYHGNEGQGYATEAATALRDWAFGVCGLPTLVSYIYPLNTASVAVAERLGGILDPDAQRQAGDDTDLVYRHRRIG